MSIKILQLRHSFQADMRSVYDYLLDLKKFGEMHPFMVEVREIAKPDDHITEYEVKEETVLLGFVKMKPMYRAKVAEIEQFKRIQYFANIKGGIVLTIDFEFEEDSINGAVTVLETVKVQGNTLLISYFMKVLKKAHLRLFENLQHKLILPSTL
jgi:hypothetical protein